MILYVEAAQKPPPQIRGHVRAVLEARAVPYIQSSTYFDPMRGPATSSPPPGAGSLAAHKRWRTLGTRPSARPLFQAAPARAMHSCTLLVAMCSPWLTCASLVDLDALDTMVDPVLTVRTALTVSQVQTESLVMLDVSGGLVPQAGTDSPVLMALTVSEIHKVRNIL